MRDRDRERRRRTTRALLLGLSWAGASAFAGCTGSSLEEGMPTNVDMSKDYTPPVQVGPILPKQQTAAKREAAKVKKAAAAAEAGSETPAP